MALVYHCQKVIRKVIEQAERFRAFGASVEISRIVLDARAVAELAYHFEVVVDALVEALGFGVLADLVEARHLQRQVVLNHSDGLLRALLRRDENVGRINQDVVERFERVAVDGFERLDGLDFVAPEYYPAGVVGVGKEDFDRVALDPELAALEDYFVAGIEGVHKLAQQHVG